MIQRTDGASGARLESSVPAGLLESSVKRPHLPGEPGIWIIILGEMMIFALFFCIFMSYRSQNVEFYRASQSTLNRGFGAINTVLLLTSSGFVVLALQTFRKRLFGKSSQLFSLAIVCGGGFAFVKLLEYYQKISAGITPATNDFYMFYFVFTGIHYFHVLIGLGLLVWLRTRSRRAWTNSEEIALIECGALFWHMIDLLWVVLFSLFYLIN